MVGQCVWAQTDWLADAVAGRCPGWPMRWLADVLADKCIGWLPMRWLADAVAGQCAAGVLAGSTAVGLNEIEGFNGQLGSHSARQS